MNNVINLEEYAISKELEEMVVLDTNIRAKNVILRYALITSRESEIRKRI